MRALILGTQEQALIDALILRASRARISYIAMTALKEAYDAGHRAPRRQNYAQTIHLPVGYQVTYTEEEHAPEVCCRHLSVSVEAANKMPSPAAFAEIMRAFHFVSEFGHCPMWLEPVDNRRSAVNVVEPLDGDLSRLKRSTT